MTQEQFLGFVRDICKVIGGALVMMGYVTDVNLAMWSGLIMTAAPIVWSIYERTQARMVAKVDAMPEVSGVVLHRSESGKALAEAVGTDTVVPAGTAQAKAVAGIGS